MSVIVLEEDSSMVDEIAWRSIPPYSPFEYSITSAVMTSPLFLGKSFKKTIWNCFAAVMMHYGSTPWLLDILSGTFWKHDEKTWNSTCTDLERMKRRGIRSATSNGQASLYWMSHETRVRLFMWIQRKGALILYTAKRLAYQKNESLNWPRNPTRNTRV